MNLSRSDKIIALIGVIILVVAAIAIFYYYTTEEEPEKPQVEPKVKTYNVTWIKGTGDLLVGESLYAGRNSPCKESVPVSVVDEPFGVLTDVNFQLSWQDDRTFGIGRRIIKGLTRGKDKLDATIKPTIGEAISRGNTWGGVLRFPFTVYDKPVDLSIEAEDIFEAEQKIIDMYMDQDATSFDVTVNIKPGEPLRRPLKYIRDKGNNFRLNATYDYYYPLIEKPPEEGGSEDEGDGGDTTTGYPGFIGIFRNNILSLGYGKGWI